MKRKSVSVAEGFYYRQQQDVIIFQYPHHALISNSAHPLLNVETVYTCPRLDVFAALHVLARMRSSSSINQIRLTNINQAE